MDTIHAVRLIHECIRCASSSLTDARFVVHRYAPVSREVPFTEIALVNSTGTQVLDLRLPSQLESLVPKKSEKSKVGVPVRIRTGDAGTEGVSTAQSSGPAGLEEGDPLNASDFATTHGRIPDDQALPTQRHVYFQLCDMKSEAMKRLIHDEGYGVLEGCSERTGWYSFKVASPHV